MACIQRILEQTRKGYGTEQSVPYPFYLIAHIMLQNEKHGALWLSKERVTVAVKIVIDAGHGGWDNGSQYNGRREKDDTLNLALAVGEILSENGIDVDYTRTTDIYETPFKKATDANNAGADYFISIHRNSGEVPGQYAGVQSLVYSDSGVVHRMAENINRELEAVGFDNIGIEERPNLVVLRRTNMPAVLVEVGFINSDHDNEIFDTRFQEVATAIADGIMQTIG